ncbi:hypothetical protein AeRB84_004461 [Aphanomyces euteiches]|nr:hypothetical protein AeRB84_004461 [Aphanomyces euteiches]
MLPVDIVLKIAFLIPDAADLFSFLEVLHPFPVLGPLKHLYLLGHHIKHAHLWPRLCLNSDIFGNETYASLEAIAKYYTHIDIVKWHDMAWFKENLNPTASIEWCLQDFQAIMEMVAIWPGIRISSIYDCVSEKTSSCWKIILTRLPHLKTLEVYGDYSDLADVFECVSTSNQITELEVVACDYQVTTADVVHLTEWFRRQPVRRFVCMPSSWDGIFYSVRQEFCDAMFNCPTLETLELYHCVICDQNFERFTFPMRSLHLVNSVGYTYALRDFAKRLKTSRITYLTLSNFYNEDVSGMEYLLGILPQTPIKYLKLTGLPLQYISWGSLPPLFEKCRLETLALGAEFIPPGFVRRLATAIQKNHTICELDLDRSEIDIQDLRHLIQAMTHRNRKVQTKRIKFIASRRQEIDASIVQSLMTLATDYGGEFKIENYSA